jgi:hypothetical protein
VRKNFTAALEKAELSVFRVYDLRYTFASLLLAQAAPITYVAAQLGHSKPTRTLQWYAHWIPSGHERFVDDIAAPQRRRTGRGPKSLGTNCAPKANRALPVVWKRPIRLVGRQGLEPWTR